jgi:hypothetical protein
VGLVLAQVFYLSDSRQVNLALSCGLVVAYVHLACSLCRAPWSRHHGYFES